MIDVNLVCPDSLLIFLIRSKRALSARKERSWVVMSCHTQFNLQRFKHKYEKIKLNFKGKLEGISVNLDI